LDCNCPPRGDDMKWFDEYARRLDKHAGKILGVFALVTIGLVMFLNFTGFCYSELRYYSDQAFIDTAVRHELESASESSEGAKTYASIDQFYRENRNCCVIHKWDPGPRSGSIWFRSFGWYIARVDVWYRRYEKRDDQFWMSQSFLSACKVVEDDIGHSWPRGPT